LVWIACDRVLVSCISACGGCRFCRERRYGQCTGDGGWILGNEVDGTQAENVRVPFADTSTYQVPEGVSDEEMLMLADILPTGYEVGVRQCVPKFTQTIGSDPRTAVYWDQAGLVAPNR
jgi:alcohol dehydrogenase